MEVQANRRVFLVGLGRFMLGAAALSIVKPPVLYSFPSEIRIASAWEQAWFYRDELAAADIGLPLGWEQVGKMAYTFMLKMEKLSGIDGLPRVEQPSPVRAPTE